jgi:hypothetical protein
MTDIPAPGNLDQAHQDGATAPRASAADTEIDGDPHSTTAPGGANQRIGEPEPGIFQAQQQAPDA